MGDDSATLLLQQVLTQQAQIAADTSALRIDLAKAITHMERIDTRNESADKLHSDHEGRLRTLEKIDADGLHALHGRVSALEKFRYTLAGGLALLALVFSALGAWIVTAVTHH